MTVFEQIEKDTIEALKSGDKARVTVLRGLKSDLKYKQIEAGDKITEEQAIEVLSSAAKKRRDSIEQFRNGGREDLAQQEESELELITVYLPKQLTAKELREMASAAIAEVGAESPRDMGEVMKSLMPQIKGKADGKMVSKLIAELLAK
jgi:uncharacterized protein YqeY